MDNIVKPTGREYHFTQREWDMKNYSDYVGDTVVIIPEGDIVESKFENLLNKLN